jgi:hypothetical protein
VPRSNGWRYGGCDARGRNASCLPRQPQGLPPPPRLCCRTDPPKETNVRSARNRFSTLYEIVCIVFGDDRFRPSLPQLPTVGQVNFGATAVVVRLGESVRLTSASRPSATSNQSSLQCQLPTSGESPLTSAVEPSQSPSPGDGSRPLRAIPGSHSRMLGPARERTFAPVGFRRMPATGSG